MIIFHSITRKVEKTGPSSKVVLEMPYEDVKDLCHVLWACRNKDMLKRDNEKFLQRRRFLFPNRSWKQP